MSGPAPREVLPRATMGHPARSRVTLDLPRTTGVSLQGCGRPAPRGFRTWKETPPSTVGTYHRTALPDSSHPTLDVSPGRRPPSRARCGAEEPEWGVSRAPKASTASMPRTASPHTVSLWSVACFPLGGAMLIGPYAERPLAPA